MARSLSARLSRLLVDLFGDAAEMKRFIRSEATSETLADGLPGDNVSAEEMAGAIAVQLEKRGLLGQSFFDALRAARPLRERAIQEVHAAWQAGGDKPVDPPVRGVGRFWVLAAIAVGCLAIGGWALAYHLLPRADAPRPPTQAAPPAPVPTSPASPTAAAPPAPPAPPSSPPGMVLLAGGRLRMGSTPEELRTAGSQCGAVGALPCEDLLARESPPVDVDVAAFHLDVHETSAAAFAAFLNAQSELVLTKDRVLQRGAPLFGLGHEKYSGIEVHAGTFAAADGFGDRPVTMVTWTGASRYCAARGARLPSEAEWEFAARGPERREYALGAGPLRCADAVFGRDPGGLRLQGKRRATRPGPCASLSPGTGPVTAADRTTTGIFGLTGNVREWVQDAWSEQLGARGEPPGPVERAIRGCGWNEPAFFCRAARRSHDQADYSDVAVGFRCARSAGGEVP